MSKTSESPRDQAPQAGAEADVAATGLRDMIRQAVSAYELALATQGRNAARAARQHKERFAELAAQETASAETREEDLRADQATVESEAERVKTLAVLAGNLADAASALLERAALAHVRGFGPGPTDVAPHIASDEQVAAAFAAAQTASVQVMALLLRFAQEHLDSGDWQRAIEVATSLTRQGIGVFASEAETVLCAASLGQVRDLLSAGDQRAAHDQAVAWLGEHPQDTEMASLLLQATIGLVVQGGMAGDQVQVESELAALIRHGADDPSLRDVLRRHPKLAWRAGRARLLGEFGSHSQPVHALAFTRDTGYLVSADDTEALTWDVAAGSQSRPVRTVPIAATRGISPDGMLILSKSGALSRTDDGREGGSTGRIAAHAFSADGSLLVWAARDRLLKLTSNFFNSGLSADYLAREYGATYSPTQVDKTRGQLRRYSEPEFRASLIESSKVGNAVYPSYPDYRNDKFPNRVSLIDSLHVFDLVNGQQVSTTELDPCHLFLEVAVSERARRIAVLTPEGQVIVEDFDSRIQVPAFRVSEARSLLNSITFSPSGDLILVTMASMGAYNIRPAENHTTMMLWDISRGVIHWSWATSRREGAVAFSPDGQLVATLAMDGTVSLFDVHAKQALPELGEGLFHGTLTSPCLAFSPDGSRLAASGYRDVKVWGL